MIQTIGMIGGCAFIAMALVGLVVTIVRSLWVRASAPHRAALQNHEQRVQSLEQRSANIEQRVANQERLLMAMQPKPDPPAAAPKKRT